MCSSGGQTLEPENIMWKDQKNRHGKWYSGGSSWGKQRRQRGLQPFLWRGRGVCRCFFAVDHPLKINSDNYSCYLHINFWVVHRLGRKVQISDIGTKPSTVPSLQCQHQPHWIPLNFPSVDMGTLSKTVRLSLYPSQWVYSFGIFSPSFWPSHILEVNSNWRPGTMVYFNNVALCFKLNCRKWSYLNLILKAAFFNFYLLNAVCIFTKLIQ